jgi:uncharacterized protein DUF5329
MNAPRNFIAACSAALALCLPLATLAAPGPVAQDEIDHLLSYVAASSCTFVRNGSEYDAVKAREHLADKYRFAGSRISTAEEFIEYLATKSSFSGQPYHVRCGHDDEPSGAWLTAELRRYRSTPHLTPISHDK